MSYIKQVLTVTRWEFGRFFKPKNELIGLFVMLIVFTLFYFGSKLAFSDKSPKITVFLLNDENKILTLIYCCRSLRDKIMVELNG